MSWTPTPAGISSGISDIGSAVGDLYTATGDTEAAASYGEAAELAQQNEQITRAAGNIQLAQQKRQLYQTQSAGAAAAGANGVKMSGSAAAVMRANAQQGGLAQAMTTAQTQINVNAYANQAQAYTAQQNEETNAASAAKTASAFSAVSGILSFL